MPDQSKPTVRERYRAAMRKALDLSYSCEITIGTAEYFTKVQDPCLIAAIEQAVADERGTVAAEAYQRGFRDGRVVGTMEEVMAEFVCEREIDPAR